MSDRAAVFIGAHQWPQPLQSEDKHAQTLQGVAERLGCRAVAIIHGARPSHQEESDYDVYWVDSKWGPIGLLQTTLRLLAQAPGDGVVLVGSELWGNLIATAFAGIHPRVTGSLVNIQGEVIHPVPGYGSALRRVLIGALTRHAIRTADAVRCVSVSLTEQAAAAARSGTRIKYVGTRVDTEYFSPIEESPSELSVISVGSLTRLKNHAVLIRALALLPPTQRPSLRLVGDGPEMSNLEALAHRLGVSEKVRLYGQLDVSRVRDELRQASIFALPSLTEGQPRALLEAWACGLPTVLSDINPHRDLAKLSSAALLAGATDEEAWASSISQLCGNSDMRRALASSGRNYVEAKHDISTGLDEYAETILMAANW